MENNYVTAADDSSSSDKSNNSSWSKTPVASTTNERRILRGSVQNVALVWLDANIEESDDEFRNSLTQLRSVINSIHTFTAINPCVAYIRTMMDIKFFMIISGEFGQSIIPVIHDAIPSLDSIFVFCDNKTQHNQWVQNWRKIKGVHTEITSICDAL
ncbi:unnamed protein product [Rotaria socialis]|uniref:Uncharacterized protein n=1 Tax=Rotaria socialis TaxID=392032 RepID=A0A818X1P8_9BILA|nr:unnamed protein product [Rotaria socialis]